MELGLGFGYLLLLFMQLCQITGLQVIILPCCNIQPKLSTYTATTTGIESAIALTTAVEMSLTNALTISLTTTEMTTADTTTTSPAITGSAIPEDQDPEPRGACVDPNQPYKARNGATFNTTCGRGMFFSTLVDTIFINTFSECADACAEEDKCTGVSFTKSEKRCEMFADAYQNVQNANEDIGP